MMIQYVAIALFLWSLAFATPRTDEGNGLDPHGNPRPKAGCLIDPNGCTATTLSADEGNGIDPHG
ncbi:MAG TPA: hypothetical protein VEK11_23645 [Thermoanaerobaculia bacterium]|nr:hypothetical protein [Thermoanaerobaculia bacterium]